VLAALLLYSQTYEQFVVFFTAFFISNLIGYAYIVRNFTKPMLRESRLEYERQNDFFNLERLSILSDTCLEGGKSGAFSLAHS